MESVFWVWAGFFVLISFLLMLDLGVFNREAHVISAKEALAWTGIWIAVALLFNGLVFFMYGNNWFGLGSAGEYQASGQEAAITFFTAYLVEKSLSLDNIFIIAMIFTYFKIPAKYQHRVLFWGILGAIVMRGILIAVGVTLIKRFSWLVYIFGALLIITGIKMLTARHDTVDPKGNWVVKLIYRYFPVTDELHEQRFLVRIDGRLFATPLLLALVLVETTDLLFAIDSIPAIFAITLDPFIILTSNVFAILGLRSLYFALAGIMEWFRYVKTSLVFVLVFVGVKMLLVNHYHIPALISLAIISAILGAGIVASITAGRSDPASLESPVKLKPKPPTDKLLNEIRRVIILVIGSTIMIIGALFLILPGPGTLIILAGLALLATEFVWAKVWMDRVKDTIAQISEKTGINRRLAKS